MSQKSGSWTRRRWLGTAARLGLGLSASALPGLGPWGRAISAQETTQGAAPSVDAGIGVSYLEVRLGMSGGFVSPRPSPSREILRGSLAWLNEVNARGGIAGRRLTLLAQDDGGDPARTAANTAALLDSGVLCLYGFTGAGSILSTLPVIHRHGIGAGASGGDLRLVGVLPGGRYWQEGPHASRVVSNRPSLDAEIAFLLRPLVESGRRRLGLYLPLDPDGRALAQAVADGLRAVGLEPPVEVSYRPGSALEKGLESATEILGSQGAEVVICSGSQGSCADFARYVRDSSWQAPVILDSSVDGEAVLERLLEAPPRSGPVEQLAQVRTIPTFDFSTAALDRVGPGLAAEMALYQGMMDKWKPRLPEALVPGGEGAQRGPTALGFEGFRHARLLTRALEEAGAELDRRRFRAALETVLDQNLAAARDTAAEVADAEAGDAEAGDTDSAETEAGDTNIAGDGPGGPSPFFAARVSEGRWVDVHWAADDPWVEQL
jgi:ABC-type branched-subunit amino acid transport system substrate-binding protein